MPVLSYPSLKAKELGQEAGAYSECSTDVSSPHSRTWSRSRDDVSESCAFSRSTEGLDAIHHVVETKVFKEMPEENEEVVGSKVN